jgi:excisionase family DNA binding protein
VVSRQDIAVHLSLSEDTVRTWVKEGKLPLYRAGKRYKFDSSGNIAEAVERDKQRQRFEREIAVLEKKILREKQFNRQVELNGELKRLKAELEELG